ARNSGASQTVSLHTGWLVALSSAPVYEATKKPPAHPSACTIACGHGLRSQRPGQRFGHIAATNDRKEQAPKTVSPHEPADIGDQYLNITAFHMVRQPAPVVGKPAANASLTTSDLNSMCQNRSGRYRSMTSRAPQTMISGKAMK